MGIQHFRERCGSRVRKTAVWESGRVFSHSDWRRRADLRSAGGVIATRFGHSSYGTLAALATWLLFALGVPMSLVIFARVASLPAEPGQTPFTFAFTFYAVSKVVLVFTAPVIIAATAAFNALAWVARKSLDR